VSYYGWIKASDSYNLMRKYITKKTLLKIDYLSKIKKFKSPSIKLRTIPKTNTNEFGNYQPTLF